MSEFTPTTAGDWIGLALFVAVALFALYKLFVGYCECQPIYDPFVAARNNDIKSAAVESLMRMESLRRPLPIHRNMEGAARTGYPIDTANLDAVLAHMGASEQDRADIIKGSKLS